MHAYHRLFAFGTAVTARLAVVFSVELEFVILFRFVVAETGRWGERYRIVIPVTVVLQRVKDVLSIGEHKVGPRFPKRVDDVVNETNLLWAKGIQ